MSAVMEEARVQAGYAPLPPAAPPVIGWGLTLQLDGRTRKPREFAAGEDGFAQAMRDGGDRLRRQGQNAIGRWLASIASHRMR